MSGCSHVFTECRDCGTFIDQPPTQTLAAKKSVMTKSTDVLGFAIGSLALLAMLGGLIWLCEVIWRGIAS